MTSPSQYDLLQDARITPIEEVLEQAAQARTGAEYSFPAANEAVSEPMWQQIVSAMGSGIIDRGGRPYWLTGLDNVNNTATITVSSTEGDAQAILQGFFHRLTQPLTISLPAVDAETVYRVAIEYTPLDVERSETGPCRIRIITGELPTTQGRKHIELWRVIRKPNQVLTDATVIPVRPRVSPTLTFESIDALRAFNVAQALHGTQAMIVGGDMIGSIYAATGEEDAGAPTRWVSVTSPAWQPLSLAAGMETRERAPAQWRIHQGHIELRGVIIRTAGDFPIATNVRVAAVPGVIKLSSGWNNAALTTKGGRSGYLEPGTGEYPSNTLWAVVSGSTTWVHMNGVKIRLAADEPHVIQP